MAKGTRFDIHTTIHLAGRSRCAYTYSCYDYNEDVYDIIPKSNECIFIGKRSMIDIYFYSIGLEIYPYRFIKRTWTKQNCIAVVKSILDCIKEKPEIFLDEFNAMASTPNKKGKYPHIKYTDFYMSGRDAPLWDIIF